jgi:hypothetical protein
MRTATNRQHGISTFATIGAFVGLGVVFLTIFLISLGGSKTTDKSSTKQTSVTNQTASTPTSSEPPFIRIPENSKIYANTQYKFMFAYPDSFGELSPSNNTPTDATSKTSFQAESLLASQKPIGNGTAQLNGKLGVFVYGKEDFKIVILNNDVTVAPVKTGNDTTWKVVSRGSTTQDIAIGDAVTVKTIKSQTGVVVYDFIYKPSSSIVLARWVFETGDNYVVVVLPLASKPDNSTLSAADTSAYSIIGSNIARTVRVTK